jgi:hypothetical protein
LYGTKTKGDKMGFFNKLLSNGCKECGDNFGLSEYSYMKIKKSRVIPESEVESFQANNFLFKNGDRLTVDFAHKMGPYYCYWVDIPTNLNPNNVPIIKLCSRQCAISYAKSNNYQIFKRGGELTNSSIILPHQNEIDEYKYKHNLGDKGFIVGD